MNKIIRFLKWLDNLLPNLPETPEPVFVDDKFMFMLATSGKELKKEE